MTPAMILDLLHAVETGERKIVRRPETLGDGGVKEFVLDDGSIVRVFEDEGVWDYVDSVVLADGTEVRFWDEARDSRWDDVRRYRPSDQAIDDVYWMEP